MGKTPKITKTAHVRGLEIDYVPHADFGGIAKDIFSLESSVSVDTLYQVVKASPEVNACITAKVEDVMTDYWKFASPSKNQKLVKGSLDKAYEFEIKSNYFKELADGLWDMFTTGNGYILKLSVDKEKLKSIMDDLSHYMARKLGASAISKADSFKIINQVGGVPNDLQVLKSSTMKINFDKTGEIASFQQEVKGEKRIYKPEDIIHLSLVHIGGGPYGYTGLEPLLSDIGTLIFAKEFAGKYFENDGIPYFIFKMLEESPGGRNYQLLKKELKDLKKKDEKYRSMVLTGNVEWDQVNKFNKDMEFQKLVEHFTQIIFVGLGVPAARVNYALAQKDATATQAGKIESGYYKGIAFVQKCLEGTLNRDLWSLFRVRKKFNRSYKIDEMREAEICRILIETGAITLEEARERIGMEPEIPEGTMGTPTGSDSAINEKKDAKREAGTEQEKGKTDNKLKSLLIRKGLMDTISVTYPNLVQIVEARVGIGNFTKGNVIWLETDTEFILFFSDGSWKYKANVSKDSIDPEAFKVEKLQHFVQISI